MTFVSEVKLGAGERRSQVRYVVALVDRHGQPVMSEDGRYQLHGGQVAASRTAPLSRSSHVETIRVSIPADQLELREEHLPALADVRIYHGANVLVAQESYPLPFNIENMSR